MFLSRVGILGNAGQGKQVEEHHQCWSKEYDIYTSN